MARSPRLAAPGLPPHLEPCELPAGATLDELDLAEVRVEHGGRDAVTAPRIRVQESELTGLTLGAGRVGELLLRDARLRDCDLSNVDARHGALRRVELTGSRLVGFGLDEGEIEELRVTGGTMMLASFAHATLRRVVFEDVVLREASFVGSRLDGVTFERCDLTGTDFRGARLRDCTIRGSSLDHVVGVDALRGVTMPWPDIVDSVAALATAAGIAVEEDDES